VYPIHEQLYQAWRSILNVQITTTEEYPHLRPASQRRGFVHETIKVSCWLSFGGTAAVALYHCRRPGPTRHARSHKQTLTNTKPEPIMEAAATTGERHWRVDRCGDFQSFLACASYPNGFDRPARRIGRDNVGKQKGRISPPSRITTIKQCCAHATE
jgi:hypothetical protein